MLVYVVCMHACVRCAVILLRLLSTTTWASPKALAYEAATVMIKSVCRDIAAELPGIGEPRFAAERDRRLRIVALGCKEVWTHLMACDAHPDGAPSMLERAAAALCLIFAQGHMVYDLHCMSPSFATLMSPRRLTLAETLEVAVEPVTPLLVPSTPPPPPPPAASPLSPVLPPLPTVAIPRDEQLMTMSQWRRHHADAARLIASVAVEEEAAAASPEVSYPPAAYTPLSPPYTLAPPASPESPPPWEDSDAPARRRRRVGARGESVTVRLATPSPITISSSDDESVDLQTAGLFP